MAETTTALRIEPSPKRVRVMVGGRYVADSTSALLVWEKPHYPTYFFPRTDVAPDVAGGGSARPGPVADLVDLVDHVSLRWQDFDHWFEEDEEVFVHARDPYKRIDILRSTRHVVVGLGGTALAESTRPTMLFETSLPARHYLPMTDVRMDLLEPSTTRTLCPYKGEAVYWNIRIGDALHTDLVWSYPAPVRESMPIAGLLCFYDEHLDVAVDGMPRVRPTTPFSVR